MSPAEVLARMASLMRPPEAHGDDLRLGAFTLRPAQAQALAAMRDAIREFGGVLVADPPGTGKTILALAAARTMHGPSPALVIAPAGLRTQWEEAAARAGVPATFVSLEALSRGRRPPPAAVVIVDEAHQARSPGTRRHARLAQACLGAAVILLSATPVVNRPRDRDALLSLFLGGRAATLRPADASRCVIRQRASADRPAVRRIGAIGEGAHVPGIAAALTALPPPVAAGTGATGAALVAMSLAMAWRSSLAALDAALRRRVQRGETMRDLLRAGRTPTREALRHWTLHDDSTQLAFDAIVCPGDDADDVGATGRASRGTAGGTVTLAALEAHLAAVRALRALVGPHRAEDAHRRAEALRALATAHPERRLVVFARHAETVRALRHAMRDEPGVVAIAGTVVRAAAGRWSRHEVLRAFGPRGAAGPEGDVRAIRILLATDVVAEGVELQGAGIVVHADLPWTPARVAQRLGRATRVGSAHREVLEAWFRAPSGARQIISLGARLRRKAAAGAAATRDAAARAAIARRLARWEAAGSPGTRDGAPQVARLPAGRTMFIAVVARGEAREWLVGERREGRWHVATSPRAVLRCLRRATRAAGRPVRGESAAATGSDNAESRGGASSPPDGTHAHADTPAGLDEVRRAIRRSLRRRAARTLLVGQGAASRHAQSDRPDRGAAAPSERHRIRQVRARLDRLRASAPALARTAIAAAHARWLAVLAGPMELARERQVDALLRDGTDDARFARRLGSILAARDRRRAGIGPTPAPDATPAPAETPGDPRGRDRVEALLLLSPACRSRRGPRVPARPSASPGSAGPR